MKNFLIQFIILNILFISQSIADEAKPYNKDFQEVFNIGKMLSHDKKFTLFFKSREMDNITGKTEDLITYDWFPQKAKKLNLDYNLPTFPEDYAYYLLNDNETLIMISGIKSIRSDFKFNLKNRELVKLKSKNKYKLFVSSLLKDCGYKDINSTYKCSYYKPLISLNLIN